MQIEELSQSSQQPENKYLYNGKELDEEFGLNWYHYGARLYDPILGRFTGVDPISDQFPWVSTYNYAENEPIGHIDLWGLQKYKPKVQSIDKPTDLVSTRMLNNLWEATKTVAIEFGSTVNDLSVKAEKFVSSMLPEQGTPGAEDFHDSGASVEGSGVEILSGNELNANGVLNTPEAKEGSTVVLEMGVDIGPPADAGGIVGDAAASSTQAARTMFYGGLLVDKASNLQGDSTSEPVDSVCNSCNRAPHGLPYRTLDNQGNPIDTIRPSGN